MASNTDKIIKRMQDSFPYIYDVHSQNSILYTLISIFGKRYGMRTDIIDRLYAMIGIDSTYNEDLELRWGSLLGVYKQANESYDRYRSRLKITYLSLNGGTANAIKYTIASAAGIENDIDKYVGVYDAWEYPYDIDMGLLGIENVVDESSLYGSVICTLDLSAVDIITSYENVLESIKQTKASGINSYLMFIHNNEDNIMLLRNADEYEDVIVRDLLEFGRIDNIGTTAVFGKGIIGNAIFGDVSGTHIIDTFTDITTENNNESHIIGGDTTMLDDADMVNTDDTVGITSTETCIDVIK